MWSVFGPLLAQLCQLLRLKASGMEKEEEICGKILDYLLRNPEAGGTLEDISGWWLESERVDQTVDRVGHALAQLTGRGLLCRRKRGKKYIYKINNRGRA